jgi:hypothetical protein
VDIIHKLAEAVADFGKIERLHVCSSMFANKYCTKQKERQETLPSWLDHGPLLRRVARTEQRDKHGCRRQAIPR